MKNFKAVVTEKTSPTFGKVFATTKSDTYKGMNKEEFYETVKDNQCFTFEVVEF